LFQNDDEDANDNRRYFQNQCGHRFHNSCISSWIRQSIQCPYCSKPLVLDEEDRKNMSIDDEVTILGKKFSRLTTTEIYINGTQVWQDFVSFDSKRRQKGKNVWKSEKSSIMVPQGIVEKFVNLKKLALFNFTNRRIYYELRDLDIDFRAINCENLLQLERLELSYTGLMFLDVSRNVKLWSITCEGNLLTSDSLYLSNNINLQHLNLNNNEFTDLDVKPLINLTGLHVSNNSLKLLDISKNIKLRSLKCSNNKLDYLDISNNPDLKPYWFECEGNPFAPNGMTIEELRDPTPQWYKDKVEQECDEGGGCAISEKHS